MLGVGFLRGTLAAGSGARAVLRFVVIIYKNHAKKAYFEKSLFFIQSQGGAWARSVAFVFVAFAFALCRAFFGLLRGRVFAWSVFAFRHFAQIGRFAIMALL